MDTGDTAKDGHGTFGAEADAYSTARQSFPPETFRYVRLCAGGDRLLDLGCGTGIPARALADLGFRVVGSDIDERMLVRARRDSQGYDIAYVRAQAEAQPFPGRSFDVVTAWSSFHWFATMEALAEARRLLVPGGLFCAVNKNETGDFKRVVHETLAPFIPAQAMPHDAKKTYDPAALLADARFQGVETHTVAVVEAYTLPAALQYVHSMSIWNLVPNASRASAQTALETALGKRATDGRVYRPLEVRAVRAYTVA